MFHYIHTILGFCLSFTSYLSLLQYKMAASVPSFKLNNGVQIPAIGLGTWQAKPGEVRQAVAHALKSGYRHIDGALCYQVRANIPDCSRCR